MNAGNIATLLTAMDEARREDPVLIAINMGSPRPAKQVGYLQVHWLSKLLVIY